MTELQEYLQVAGYGERQAQTKLYEHLIGATRQGVVAQAGTGTGKSAGIIAAAAHKTRQTGQKSIIVTPTLTLMNQYRDGDIPVAQKAYDDLLLTELRGRAHYYCEMTELGYHAIQSEYPGGCEGIDSGCSERGARGCKDFCEPGCDGSGHPSLYQCDYQAAKGLAREADIVVTNSDMLIVNDRILIPLGAEIFPLEGSLFVDEAHMLEQKLRDYASRSLWHKNVERFQFAGDAGKTLARWLERQDKDLALKDTRGFPSDALLSIANARIPDPRPKDGLTKQRETQDACLRIAGFLEKPHGGAVVHVHDGSLKMDWINVAASSGELLQTRDFGLVSATVPRTMASSLGVPSAPFIDVGHPFDYSKAWIGFSAYGGDYKSAQHDSNFEQRVNEVMNLIRRSKGGALILFSSFRDLERVHERLLPIIRAELGVPVFRQERDMEPSERQAMADAFKSDGNAVLFGSASFATGLDVPGSALRLLVVWKLPYPAVDPVSRAIMESSPMRYNDAMTVSAVQALGRLIRTETDRGVAWIADARGRRLLNGSDPLTSHLVEWCRL